MNDTDIDAPDAFDVALECRAWRQAPRIIGGPSHHHVCRQPTEHDGPHACGCGETFTRPPTP